MSLETDNASVTFNRSKKATEDYVEPIVKVSSYADSVGKTVAVKDCN